MMLDVYIAISAAIVVSSVLALVALSITLIAIAGVA